MIEMAKTSKGRGVIIEAKPLSGNAARNRGAQTVGKLRIEPGFREIHFESEAAIKVGDVVEFAESREGIARNLVKVAKRYY